MEHTGTVWEKSLEQGKSTGLSVNIEKLRYLEVARHLKEGIHVVEVVAWAGTLTLQLEAVG